MQEAISKMCITQFVATYAFQKIQTYTKNGIDPLTLPAIQKVVKEIGAGNLALRRCRSIFTWPTYDELVVTPDADRLVQRYCSAGVTIKYVKYPPRGHVTGLPEGYPGRGFLAGGPVRRQTRIGQLLSRPSEKLRPWRMTTVTGRPICASWPNGPRVRTGTRPHSDTGLATAGKRRSFVELAAAVREVAAGLRATGVGAVTGLPCWPRQVHSGLSATWLS